MSDKAAGQKARTPEGGDENGPAAALLLSHVSIHSTRCRLLMASLECPEQATARRTGQICSFVACCRWPILIAALLHQSLTWCSRCFFGAATISAFGLRAVIRAPETEA